MRIFELAKPKSPEQLRLDQLRASSNRASDALKIERERQKAQRAQKALQQLRKPKSNTTKLIQTVKPSEPKESRRLGRLVEGLFV